MSEAIPTPDENNAWRLETEHQSAGWDRSPYPDAEKKYFMVSADGHVQEPKDLWHKRVPEEFHHRLPGVQVNNKGDQFQKLKAFGLCVSVISRWKVKMHCETHPVALPKRVFLIWH